MKSAKSFQELHDALSIYRKQKTWIFRGQARSDWDLLPKCGRRGYDWVDDFQVFTAWKRRAIQFIDFTPSSDWEWLAVAQHHGLATRLLDWTSNPLYAAFFAAWGHPDQGGVVFAARIKREVDIESDVPQDYQGVGIFRPPGVVPRIVRQSGLFTIHGSPKEPLMGPSASLQRIEIPAESKAKILSELSFYGVNSATLFPDLDGLANFVN